MKFRAKLCGLTRPEDIKLGMKAGFSALGLIHYSPSPRHLELSELKNLRKLIAETTQCFLVVVDEPIESLKHLIDHVKPNVIQLHGTEDVSYLKNLRQSKPKIKIIKAVRVTEKISQISFNEIEHLVDGFLFDTYVKGQPGGTGESFNWELIQTINISKPFILSGGLEPSSISKIAQSAKTWVKQPVGLDFNSKLETSPGVKCSKAVYKMIHEMQRFDVLGSGDMFEIEEKHV